MMARLPDGSGGDCVERWSSLHLRERNIRCQRRLCSVWVTARSYPGFTRIVWPERRIGWLSFIRTWHHEAHPAPPDWL